METPYSSSSGEPDSSLGQIGVLDSSLQPSIAPVEVPRTSPPSKPYTPPACNCRRGDSRRPWRSLRLGRRPGASRSGPWRSRQGRRGSPGGHRPWCLCGRRSGPWWRSQTPCFGDREAYRSWPWFGWSSYFVPSDAGRAHPGPWLHSHKLAGPWVGVFVVPSDAGRVHPDAWLHSHKLAGPQWPRGAQVGLKLFARSDAGSAPPWAWNSSTILP